MRALILVATAALALAACNDKGRDDPAPPPVDITAGETLIIKPGCIENVRGTVVFIRYAGDQIEVQDNEGGAHVTTLDCVKRPRVGGQLPQ